MIYTDCTIRMHGNGAVPDRDLFIFKGGQNISINFKIVNNSYNLTKADEDDILKRTGATSVIIKLKRQNGGYNGISEEIPVIDGVVTLELTQEIIECMIVGNYDYEFTLLDVESNSIMTLPSIKSCFHVKDKIFEHGHSLDTPASALNVALCNVSVAAFGLRDDIDESTVFDEEGNYNRTVWIDGDLITDVRLNKIEEAIYGVNYAIKNIDFSELATKTEASTKFDDVKLNEKQSTSRSTVLDFYGNGVKLKTISFSNADGEDNAYISTTLDRMIDLEVGEDLTLPITFKSTNYGIGTLNITINNVLVKTGYLDQGETEIVIPTSAFKKGENKMLVSATDDLGVTTNTLSFIVRYGTLELTTTFNSDDAYDVGSAIRYYFTPNAVDTNAQLTFHITIDGELQPEVACTSGVRGYFTFPQSLTVGAHYCEAWISNGTKESNKLTFSLALIDDESIVIASNTKSVVIEEGDQLSLDYKIFKKNQEKFNITIYIDNTEVGRGTADASRTYYRTSALTKGNHTIKIVAEDLLQTVSDEVSWEIKVTASTYDLVEPVVTSGVFIASAMNLTNADENKEIWQGRNQDGDIVNAYLYNFSYNENNGWIDDSLIITGNSYVEVPVQPLANNARYGFSLDINFYTRAIGAEHAEVLRMWNDEKDCGILITTDRLLMRSANKNELNLFFSEEEFVNAIFVIDRDEKTAKIYLNGVMCGAFHLSDYSADGVNYLEDFTVNSNIILGGQNENSYCRIKSLRVYEVALSTDEILTNFISCTTNKSEQKQLVEFQSGTSLPTLTIYCDFSGLGKDDKKPCNIVYNSTDETLYGKSFALQDRTCQLQYQGTSSMAYPIKNYRLNLRDEKGDKYYYDFPFGKPECRFTLKADFMSSGHWQNTGLTKWINDNLYHYDSKDAKSMNPKKWYDLQNGGSINDTRECIYGFPCRLILVNDGTTALNEGQNEPTPGNTKDMGIFNFNHDKDSTTTMGFDQANFPNCASYEVTANSDTSAGAFMSYDEVANADVTELQYIKQSFELRFPDAKKVSEDWGFMGIPGQEGTGLKALIDWVDSSSDEEFVRDFEQHFHKDYTLRYYLLVIALGMVDNLGKNMMLDTWDNKIYMPRFYDCDTICSYDNSGDIKFDVDIEMEQGYWNTSSSRLWTRIRDLFHDELVEKYNDMRQNGLSYESLMKCFYDEQIAKIPQKYYNMDYDVKYAPFGDSYIGMAHGNGYEHLKRWLKRRLQFTDSLFDYAPSYINEVLTIRANTTEDITLEIETYNPVYQHLSWYNGQMDKKKIDGKTSITFTGRVMAETDQEILIYGGSNIKKITGISNANPNQMLIGSATRLIELDASNSPLLADINSNKANLLPHTYLNKLDLSNCPLLDGNLRVNNSPLLREIDITGTGITGLNLPSSLRNLESLKLSNTITTLKVNDANSLKELIIPTSIEYLSLINVPSLTTLSSTGNLDKLNTLIMENPTINPVSNIISKAPNLQYVRLTGLNITCSASQIQTLLNAKGIDSFGNEIPLSQAISGKVALSQCSESLEQTLRETFPLVEFTITDYVKSYTVTFVDGDGNTIYVTEVLNNGEAVYVGDTPTKTSTAQYDYEWKGWDRQLKPITANTTITARFDSVLRYYTIRFINSDTLEVIDSQYLAYGSTPTKPPIPEGYNSFKPSVIEAVTKDFDYYTQYLPYPDDLSMFEFISVYIDNVSGYTCILSDSTKVSEMAYMIIPFQYNDKPVVMYSHKVSDSSVANLTDVYVPDSLIALSKNAFSGMSSLETREISFPNVKYFTLDNYGYNLGEKFMGVFYGAKANILKFPKITSIKKGLQDSNYPLFGKSTVNYVVFGSEEYPFTAWYEGQYSAAKQAFGDSTIKTIYLVTKNGKSTDVTFSGENFLKKSLIKYVKATPKFLRDDLFQYVVADNAATVVSYHGTASEVVVPSTIEGYPVTRISGSTFYENTTITKIVAPSVTGIGSSCFYKCTNLSSVELPELTFLASSCFAYCSNLTSIKLPKVTSLDYYCFEQCTRLSSASFPMATSTGTQCFYKCINLSSVELPLAKKLGGSCFSNCSKLASINLPEVTSITSQCFYNCSKLSSINAPLVKSIESSCFSGCSSLTSIELPLITKLPNNCFEGCRALTSINIPLVTSAGNNCFYQCDNLTSINLPEVTTLGDNCFYYCTRLTSVTVPKVTSLGSACFQANSALTSIELPLVTSAGNNCFNQCIYLTSINLPLATNVGNSCFYGCSSLTSAEFPEATTIGNSCFYGCSKLTSVTIPKVTSLGSNCFRSCSNLETINIPLVTSIGSECFYYCKKLTTVAAPQLHTANSGSFAYCESLKEINLPSFTTVEGNNMYDVFKDCTSLEDIYLGCLTTTKGILGISTPKIKLVVVGKIGNPILSDEGFSSSPFYTQNAITLKIYVEDVSNPPTFTKLPWGATNATVVYEQA